MASSLSCTVYTYVFNLFIGMEPFGSYRFHAEPMQWHKSSILYGQKHHFPTLSYVCTPIDTDEYV